MLYGAYITSPLKVPQSIVVTLFTGDTFSKMVILTVILLLSCHANVCFIKFILNPKVECVEETHEAAGSVCGNGKECR